jgi:RNA polymerase sigma-70 factor, ECF subfamily
LSTAIRPSRLHPAAKNSAAAAKIENPPENKKPRNILRLCNQSGPNPLHTTREHKRNNCTARPGFFARLPGRSFLAFSPVRAKDFLPCRTAAGDGMATYAASGFDLAATPDPAIESSLTGRVRPIRELDDIDALSRAHRARLIRFAAYATNDPDLAETVAQDTLLRAYNGRENFRGDCSVGTWLTGIAINVLRNHQRTERYKFWKKVKSTAVDVHEMASFLPADGASPEARLLAKEKVKQLAEVLKTLSNNQRTIFLMRFTEEMEVADISEVLGMQLNTVRTHLHRALTTVRSRLGANL